MAPKDPTLTVHELMHYQVLPILESNVEDMRLLGQILRFATWG
jgi:hypothetical protein